MDDIQGRYSPEELSKLAEESGKMFALFLDGFIKGYTAKTAELAESKKAQRFSRRSSDGKTSADCCNCWCNQCENARFCNQHRENVKLRDGMPLPCCGCRTGERFAPIENPPPCGKFKVG